MDLSHPFWRRVRIGTPDECWPRLIRGQIPTLFDGTPTYGQYTYEGQNHNAHRVALILSGNKPKAGEVARHLCHFPPCCNPNHLAWGTILDNMRDSVIAGRMASIKGDANASTKLPDGKLAEVRKRYAEGGITQARLASEYGVSQSLVSLVTSGRHRG